MVTSDLFNYTHDTFSENLLKIDDERDICMISFEMKFFNFTRDKKLVRKNTICCWISLDNRLCFREVELNDRII